LDEDLYTGKHAYLPQVNLPNGNDGYIVHTAYRVLLRPCACIPISPPSPSSAADYALSAQGQSNYTNTCTIATATDRGGELPHLLVA
jgi:hypothetical protein